MSLNSMCIIEDSGYHVSQVGESCGGDRGGFSLTGTTIPESCQSCGPGCETMVFLPFFKGHDICVIFCNNYLKKLRKAHDRIPNQISYFKKTRQSNAECPQQSHQDTIDRENPEAARGYTAARPAAGVHGVWCAAGFPGRIRSGHKQARTVRIASP
jgi:hypothetical protein